MKYVQGEKEETPGCIFCALPALPDGNQSLVIARGKFSYVIMNRYPYTSGHLMVIPYQHQSALERLSPAERAEAMELCNQGIQVLQNVYKPQGFNVGFNLGAAAGAGIAEHIHLHIVPRWSGDSNFMTAIGMTRVLPESMEESYARLVAGWHKLFGS
jgi:ATP adenylyltransferase